MSISLDRLRKTIETKGNKVSPEIASLTRGHEVDKDVQERVRRLIKFAEQQGAQTVTPLLKKQFERQDQDTSHKTRVHGYDRDAAVRTFFDQHLDQQREIERFGL